MTASNRLLFMYDIPFKNQPFVNENLSGLPSACFEQTHKCQPHAGIRGNVRGGSLKSLGFILCAPWISAFHPHEEKSNK